MTPAQDAAQTQGEYGMLNFNTASVKASMLIQSQIELLNRIVLINSSAWDTCGWGQCGWG